MGNICIGLKAGANLTKDNVTIIGDDILDVPDDTVLAIGKTVFGKPCNLIETLKDRFNFEEIDDMFYLKVGENG